LSLIKPEFVKFRYKLEGQDAEWVEAGTRRTAYYSYLLPGEYVFTVIAANSDGVWNTTGKTLRVKVIPPFYRTWWFLILSLATGVGAAYLLYRRRISQLERQRRMQEKFSHELLASQETERQRVAAELHDGLGQSLLLIKNRALLGTMSPDDKSEAQEQFEEISRASSQALEEVREIAYNLRPYHLDRLGLTQSIKAMLESINDSTDIDFAYDIMPLDGVFPKNEEVIVYRIIQECVNNIIKQRGGDRSERFNSPQRARADNDD
jgi:signal transduction histidine kinase